MKVSVNHIRRLNQAFGSAGDPAPDGVPALIERIGAQLGAVEETVAIGERYEGIVVVQVVSCEDHPNADRLHVCRIDDGGKIQGVERGEDGFVQVICGAPNVRAGILVAWLPPGSTVPSSYETTEPFVLSARTIRGTVSNGMLASPKELAIGDNHDGILEIEDTTIPVGSSFAKAFGLHDDTVIDMENKMFTHRPDCFGVMGIAREIAGIYQQAYKSPEWYQVGARLDTADGNLKVEVRNELPELVQRFVVVPMSDVTIKPSPVWLQVDLSRLGIRPINNIVDLTNYYMVLTGQPIHAYDYDKVKALSDNDVARLVVRRPKPGEKITLLNGKTIEPNGDTMMVATDTQLICVGGAIGGSDTEVDEATKNIIIEAANWDMYQMRRTAMAYGIFTDAVTRFTKGQSPLQNVAVIAKLAADVAEVAGGQIAGKLVDDNHIPAEVLQRGSLEAPVRVEREFVNDRLGLDLPAEEMSNLLRNVEFVVTVKEEMLEVSAPFWRTDIAIPEDVVEEVGRLYGFDHLPLVLPKRDITPAQRDPLLEFKYLMRRTLSKAGANEVLTYSFVHGKLLEKVGQDKAQSYQLSNALSPELQYYRTSLTPSLLDKVHPNVKAGYDEFALFELNKTHNKAATAQEDALPEEQEMLALVLTASDRKKRTKVGAAYYAAKEYLEAIAKQCGIELSYTPYDVAPGSIIGAPYEYRRAAKVTAKGSDVELGVVGEYRQEVLHAMKLPVYTAGFEVYLDRLMQVSRNGYAYVPLPKFPKIEQDICLRVGPTVSYQALASFVSEELANVMPERTRATCAPLDIYKSPETSDDYKQITFRITAASYERTLTDDEINASLESLAQRAKESLGAIRV